MSGGACVRLMLAGRGRCGLGSGANDGHGRRAGVAAGIRKRGGSRTEAIALGRRSAPPLGSGWISHGWMSDAPRRLLSCAGMIRIRFEGSFSARRASASRHQDRLAPSAAHPDPSTSRTRRTPPAVSGIDVSERHPGIQPRSLGGLTCGDRIDRRPAAPCELSVKAARLRLHLIPSLAVARLAWAATLALGIAHPAEAEDHHDCIGFRIDTASRLLSGA